MGYYINLKKISLHQLIKILETADIIPSWQPLRDNIESNLELIEKQGIKNLDDLLEALKSKQKLQAFSQLSGLSEGYLALLRRMVNGYRPKPNRIKDFPDIDSDPVLRLEGLGIKNTRQLFDRVIMPKDRKVLSEETGIDKKTILRLTRLTDLSRIRWVNHTFAFVLLEAGYDSAEMLANTDYKELYEAVKRLNEVRKLFPAHIGIHDMKRCVEAAQKVPFDIHY